MNYKNHIVISIDAENTRDKIQYPILIKIPNKSHTEIIYIYRSGILNTIKAMYNKPRANILLNSGKLKAFLLKSETRQGCLPLPRLFNRVLKVLVSAKSKRRK
jgi:hypothetical protein